MIENVLVEIVRKLMTRIKMKDFEISEEILYSVESNIFGNDWKNKLFAFVKY